MKNNFEKYHQAVEYLESIPILSKTDYFTKKSGRSFFLKRFEYFLKLLDNPHKNLKYIHISGSSGKGSVANMIESILTKAGYNIGLYTSPHCTTTIERIKADGLFINPNKFAGLVKKLKPKINYAAKHSPYGRPSYFEIITAMAFLYFKSKKCDYVVLEVGLGGNFDATNIIPKAEITVINLISHDHVKILGKTLTKIAKEKTAIIKSKTTVFTTSKNKPSVLNILEQACKKNKVKLNIIKPPKINYQLPVLGKHQQYNAELAAKICQKLAIAETRIKAGLRKVKLPCRFEIIQKNPTVILDGAHSVSKMKTTVNTIKNLTYKKLYTIIALTNDRNASEVFEEIVPLTDHLFITRFQSTGRKCYPPLKLAKKLKNKKPTEINLDAQMALDKALMLAGKNDLILVTGSFYLAGFLRKHWRSEKNILKEHKI